MNESYSETPYQESTSDLLTENSYGMVVDYNSQQQQQQQQQQSQEQQNQTQQQQQQQNSQQPDMSFDTFEDQITVSYYDQQGVMQTYTYGKGQGRTYFSNKNINSIIRIQFF